MAKEIRADPGALTDLADASLSAAERIGEHFRTGYQQLPQQASVFGTVGGAVAAAGTMALLMRDAQSAITELVAVLEDDADRLLRTAFAYHAADREADQRMGGSRKAPA